VRLFVVVLVTIGSFGFKNVNVILAIGGSLLGTAMTIVMPVVFYNRAFSSNAKHLSLDKNSRRMMESEPEFEGLISREKDQDREPESGENMGLIDNRRGLKVMNMVVLVVGVTIGFIGLIDALREL